MGVSVAYMPVQYVLRTSYRVATSCLAVLFPSPTPPGSKACLPSSYRLTFGESTIRVRICTFSPGRDEGIAR